MIPEMSIHSLLPLPGLASHALYTYGSEDTTPDCVGPVKRLQGAIKEDQGDYDAASEKVSDTSVGGRDF